MSLLLFNLYSEEILIHVFLVGVEEGIIINGKLVNNIRYADDTLLLASTSELLQSAW